MNKHIKEQNWFALGIELFIVCLAVFIGLQADNWNQDRIAKATAKTYYSRLIEDMRAEESNRLARIAYYEKALKHGKSALLALNQPNSKFGQQFLIDLYQSSQLWNYNPFRATYDELLSIGIANAIPDPEIRLQLAILYTDLDNSRELQQEITPFRNNLRSYMPFAVQSEISRNCGDLPNNLVNGSTRVYLAETCDLTLDPTLISEAVAALSSYAGMKRDLTRRLGDLEGKLRNLETYIPRTREMIKRLEEKSSD